MTETGIPWIIRCTPDDRQTGYRLARLLFEERGLSRVIVLRSGNRYGRLGIKEFRDAARRLGRAIPMELQLPPGQEEFASQLDRLEQAGPEAVVLWTSAHQAGLIVQQMRKRGIDLPVFGTDRLINRDFLTEAGKAAEGVTATSWLGERGGDPRWSDFETRYLARYGNEPDAFAAYGYEAAGLLVSAIRSEGLNRARIRDALTAVRMHEGVAGRMIFDETSNNVSPLFLARVQGGRFVFD
jgi:branched-chain amino acid transport system substrate-binding protein